ncbi:MAG: sulfatase family protein [Solirubrobacteraceae bacterium]
MLYFLLRHRRLRLLLGLLIGAGVVGAVAVVVAPSSSRRILAPLPAAERLSHQSAPPLPAAERSRRPNIVFVLTDDLSMNLLRYMPNVQAMQQGGLTFNDYFVSDSLCCPSRSSIFSGNFPHDTGVFNNVGTNGGFHVFHNRGEEQHTFAVALQQAGYRTAMMGKYLNGYMQRRGGVPGLPDTYVPPGWSEWDVAGWGYPEFDYQLNENGTLHAYGHQPSDYLTDVLAGKGVDFINRSAQTGNPFFLELATFAPHGPYVPAPRDANDFPGLTAPRPPSFDVLPSHPPGWLAYHPPLTPAQIDTIDSAFRLRVQSVQAVDAMIGQIEQTLAENGIADNTYLVFSSDNGLHTGEYRLAPGKLTAFDTDIHVPLVVVGPGVPAGTSTDAMTENVDLAKTFAGIGGTALPSDGHTLLPLLRGETPADWRNASLVEHNGSDLRGVDPDFQQPTSGNPRTYNAIRTKQFLYVQYNDNEREFYDLRRDPFELHNLGASLTPSDLALLGAEVRALRACHDGPACWAAMHLEGGPALPLRARRRGPARPQSRHRR